MLHALITLSLAAELELSTGGQVHPGVAEHPQAWGLGWGRVDTGAVTLEGYAQGTLSGARVYVLAADGRSDALSWTLGRHRLVLPTQPRFLDGASLSWRLGDYDLDLAAGWLTVAGLSQGSPMARARLTHSAEWGGYHLGLWVEQEGLGGSLQVHPEIGLRAGGLRVGVVSALAHGEDAVFEQIRAEWRGHPAAGVDLGMHFEHREAPPLGTASSPDILRVFTPEGMDQVGAVLGYATVGRARVVATGDLRTWELPGQEPESLERVFGGAATLTAKPSGPDWTPQPSWRMATGPLGTVHSFQASSTLPTPERLRLVVHGGLAPYHMPFADWALAGWAGLTTGVEIGPVGLRAGGELGRSEFQSLDRRAWAVLEWTL